MALSEPRASTAAVHPVVARLRRERVDGGLSLKVFERKCGINAVVIGSYERGDRAVSLAQLTTWAAAFGLEPVLRPIGSDTDDAYQRGYDAATAQVCRALGIRVDDADFAAEPLP